MCGFFFIIVLLYHYKLNNNINIIYTTSIQMNANISAFTSKENIQILWDVISDHDTFKFLTPRAQNEVFDVFINNIQAFYESGKHLFSLVELNKKYILSMLNNIKQNHSVQPSKIQIYNEPVKTPITFEEIQNNKRSQFDRELSRKQEEFEETMTRKAPPAPEFADKMSDEPIRDMDKILKEMQASRNYDVDQIKRSQPVNHAEDWLKSEKTSLKNDKFTSLDDAIEEVKPILKQTNGASLNTKFKHLHLLEVEPEDSYEEIVNTSPKTKVENNKKVSFYENEMKEEEEEDNNRLFSKLKKIPHNAPPMSKNVDMVENEKQMMYERILQLEKIVLDLHTKIDKITNSISTPNETNETVVPSSRNHATINVGVGAKTVETNINNREYWLMDRTASGSYGNYETFVPDKDVELEQYQLFSDIPTTPTSTTTIVKKDK